MFITFFDVRGIVHSEFLPQGQTINQQVYNEILRLLLRSVREKRQTRVVAGQIVGASPRQCTCSQRPEHPAVPGREEHRRLGVIMLLDYPPHLRTLIIKSLMMLSKGNNRALGLTLLVTQGYFPCPLGAFSALPCCSFRFVWTNSVIFPA